MDNDTHYVVTPRGQKGNNLQFYRIAIRGSKRPLRTLKAYIKKQREQGRFEEQVYIEKAKSQAPFAPQFESDTAQVYEYPVENGTGLLEE